MRDFEVGAQQSHAAIVARELGLTGDPRRLIDSGCDVPVLSTNLVAVSL